MMNTKKWLAQSMDNGGRHLPNLTENLPTLYKYKKFPDSYHAFKKESPTLYIKREINNSNYVLVSDVVTDFTFSPLPCRPVIIIVH